MLPISCIRCDRPYFSASAPGPGVRCPVCRGRLEVSAEGPASKPRYTAMPLGLPPIPVAAPHSFRDTAFSFASLIDFVNDDPRRGPSAERDFGLRWRDAADRLCRAAWVHDTGELTLIQMGDPADGGGHVEILGVACDEREVVARLAGWELRCGEPSSVEWLRMRAAERLEEPVRPVAATVRIGARRSKVRRSGGSQLRPSVLGASSPTIG